MSDDLKDKLERYLTGNAPSPSEQEALEAADAFRQFQARKDAGAVRSGGFRWLAYAASAACIALVAGLLLRAPKGMDAEPFTASAPAGEVCSVTLPDGTLVWLNSSSTLSCSKDFGVQDRAVTLSGQGYFEVVRNESLPMVINSETASITVLGTKFDFCDYPQDTEASVTLYEGRVSFSCPQGAVRDLLPGQSATLSKSDGRIDLTSSDSSLPASWRDGILIFEDCTLERICRELSCAYGTSVRITGQGLSSLRFSAEFNVRTQSLADVLDALSLTRHLSFRFTEAGAEIF